MRVIVVDDEPLSRKRLRQLLQVEPDVEVLAECANGTEALAAISALQPDVAFVDVEMPGMNGFELVAALDADNAPLIIFVTAYDEYAVRAFDVLALDYVLKPIAAERLSRACERAAAALGSRERVAISQAQMKQLLDQLGQHGSGQGQAGLANRLLVKTGDRVVILKPEDIQFIEAAGNYVKIHAPGGPFMIRETLSHLEATLDPARFARIHKSTLINLDCVKEMQPWYSGDMIVIMNDGTKLKLSRTFRSRFEERNRLYS